MKDKLINYHPRALRKYISEYNKEQRADISAKIKEKRKEFSEKLKAERKGQKMIREIKIPKGIKKEGLVKLVMSRASMKIKAENDFKNKTALEGFEFKGEVMQPIKGFKKPKAEPKGKQPASKKKTATIGTQTEEPKPKPAPAKKEEPKNKKVKYVGLFPKSATIQNMKLRLLGKPPYNKKNTPKPTDKFLKEELKGNQVPEFFWNEMIKEAKDLAKKEAPKPAPKKEAPKPKPAPAKKLKPIPKPKEEEKPKISESKIAQKKFTDFINGSVVQKLLKLAYESYKDGKIILTENRKKDLKQKQEALRTQFRPSTEEIIKGIKYDLEESKKKIVTNLLLKIGNGLNFTIETYIKDIKSFNKKYTLDIMADIGAEIGSEATGKKINDEIKTNDFLLKMLDSLIDRSFQVIPDNLKPTKGKPFSKDKMNERYERLKEQLNFSKIQTAYEKNRRLIPKRLKEIKNYSDVEEKDKQLKGGGKKPAKKSKN